MKKAIIFITVAGALVLLGYLLYYVGFYYAFRDFGLPKQPDPLFTYETAGRIERLENAIQQVVRKEKLSYAVKYSARTAFNHLTIYNKADKFEYIFSVHDCQSFYHLVHYRDNWGCSISRLNVSWIKRNGVTIFDINDKKIDKAALKICQQLFEDAFFNAVQSELEKQPRYSWKINTSQTRDSIFTQVVIYDENDTSHVVTRHFFVRFPDTVLDTVTRTVKEERYFADSTVVIVYDTAHGMDIVDRYTLIGGKPVRRQD